MTDRLGPLRAQGLEHLHAAEAGHLEVGDDHVVVRGPGLLQAFLAGGGGLDVQAPRLAKMRRQLRKTMSSSSMNRMRPFVGHDVSFPSSGAPSGQREADRELRPLARLLRTSIVPWCRSTTP